MDTTNKFFSRGDKNARNAFEAYIGEKEFDILEWDGEGICPADVYARSKKSKEKYFFEIKKTKYNDNRVCFGAATLTEWKAAFENPDHYFFVIAFEHNTNKFDFYINSPVKLMRYSCLPPFKVYFNIPYEYISG